MRNRGAYLRSFSFTSFFLFLAIAVLPQFALCQSTFATLLGTVKDPTGKVASGAIVQLINKGTSATRSAITNDSGDYAFPNIEPDAYSVTISVPGFTKAEFPNVELEARETRRLDATLKVASQVATVMSKTQWARRSTPTPQTLQSRKVAVNLSIHQLPSLPTARAQPARCRR